MRILLAVSGGIDSMYLASRATELFPASEFGVAHCNFHLRGEESDGDALFVQNWAQAHSLPFFLADFQTEEYARQNGVSIEMAARKLRYGWFKQICAQEGYDALATAHNANDNAETLMLNLLRGTGSRGLCGMKEDSTVDGLRILRPLLGTSRESIRMWMEDKHIQWREDCTNAQNTYKRNSIRNEVFPLFEKINPSFLSTLGKDMEHFRQIDAIAQEMVDNCGLDPDNINLAQLMTKPHWEYLLYRLTEGKLGESELSSLKEALSSGRNLSGKEFGPLVVASGILRQKAIVEGDCCFVVEGPGIYEFRGKSIRIELLKREELPQLKQPSGILVADAQKLRFPFLLRGWEQGDFMEPLGLKGSKKLSDLFVDLKWGQPLKETAVVAVVPGSGNHVCALLCERIDESIRISDDTLSVIRISL